VPLAPNNSGENRARNRRVEILIKQGLEDELNEEDIELLKEGEDGQDILRELNLLNDKIDDLSSALAIESHLLDRIAHRAQEVNISACGLAFNHEELIAEGSRIRLELTLYPEETKVRSDGVVVSCELMAGESENYYCRIDFLLKESSSSLKASDSVFVCALRNVIIIPFCSSSVSVFRRNIFI